MSFPQGTPWNDCTDCPCTTDPGGCASIVTPPFSYDSDLSSFIDVEKRMMISIWRAVAEDYAVWDVDVTTEDPGAQALSKSSSTDLAHGIRVAIGGSCLDWNWSQGCGGIAYMSSFTWNR